MLWTLQLTPWAVPPAVALLLVVRELLFLWPRRREPTSRALIPLAVACGAWAAFHVIAVVSPDLGVKVALERAQYVAIAAVPVAWARFAIAFGQRPRHGTGPAMVVLYVLSAATAVLAVHPQGFSLIVADAALAAHPSGLRGLQVTYGPWFWVQTAIRFVAIIAATTALAGWMARTAADRKRAPVIILACLCALAPTAVHLASRTGAQWLDFSPTGFGAAAFLMGWGLLRHRLLNLGPVARTLVMVELRDPIVVMDGRGRIVDVNRAAERMLGLEPYGDVPVGLGRLWASSRGEGNRSAQIILPAVIESGERSERVFDITLTPLGRTEGAGRTALLFSDVTEREKAKLELVRLNAELEHEANTDGLTGLANRRRFMATLAREVDRSARYGRPLSLVVLDLDHFKRVNDTHGHPVGDRVLQDTAEALRWVCRDVDLPARLGGEEMAVLLPETDADGAAALAQRLRERIGSAEHAGAGGRTFHVTASIGVAAMATGSPVDVETLLRAADDALYAAKEAGRNRVVVTAGD